MNLHFSSRVLWNEHFDCFKEHTSKRGTIDSHNTSRDAFVLTCCRLYHRFHGGHWKIGETLVTKVHDGVDVFDMTLTKHVFLDIREYKKMGAGNILWVGFKSIEHGSIKDNNRSIIPISSSNINETLSDEFINIVIHCPRHLL